MKPNNAVIVGYKIECMVPRLEAEDLITGGFASPWKMVGISCG